MSKAYDVIIIGGGHNGLTAATLLAKQGKSVLLLERRPILGGIAAGEEFHPGYRTAGLLDDTSQIDPKVVSALQLEQYGLKLQKHRPSVALLTKDKGTLTLHHDTEQTVNEILRVSPLDAEAYRKYRGFIGEVSPFFNSLFSSMPPDLSGFDSKRLLKLAQLGLKLKRLGKRTMVELLKVAPMSVSDFLDDYFESDALKSGMALPAIRGSFTSPRSAYTTLNLLKWECSASASIVGGAAALIDALAKAAEAAKVEIRTGAEVEEILLDDQRTAVGVRLIGGKEQRASVIASSATPRHTFFDLLAPHHLSHDLEQDIQHYRSRGMTAKMHLAVDGQINFGSNTPTTTHARTCSNWLDMEKAFDPTKYGQYSSHPPLEICIPSFDAPQLAPDGHSVISVLVHHVPYELRSGWSDTERDELATVVVDALNQCIPSIKDKIVGMEMLTPLDLEQRYGLTGGQIYHGEHAVDQLLTRPLPSCAQYATPIPGLYLCGSGSFPGGGITGTPGRLAAGAMVRSS